MYDRGLGALALHREAPETSDEQSRFAHAVDISTPEKLPHAWWRVENAKYGLALRINRLNGDWPGLAANPIAPAHLNRSEVARRAAA